MVAVASVSLTLPVEIGRLDVVMGTTVPLDVELKVSSVENGAVTVIGELATIAEHAETAVWASPFICKFRQL